MISEIKKWVNVTIIFPLILVLLSSFVFAAAPVLNSVVGGGKEPEPLDSSLVGYWDMDDRNGTYVYDLTSNDNDGKIKGIVNRTYGKLGWGMVFDTSSEDIEVADTSDFTFGDGTTDNPFSISLWINPRDATGDHSFTTKSSEWRFWYESSKLRMRLVDGDEVHTIETDTQPLNQWSHLV
ncbi:MAG: hypothetical protein QF535_09860, partial [Anaerolineales bacterium]|nr:hypothetical protein [Anaerolineales bacterium]